MSAQRPRRSSLSVAARRNGEPADPRHAGLEEAPPDPKPGSSNSRAEGHLLSVAELAAYLGVPQATIYWWRSRGEGPPGFRLGKHLRFRPFDIEAWLETRRDAWTPLPSAAPGAHR